LFKLVLRAAFTDPGVEGDVAVAEAEPGRLGGRWLLAVEEPPPQAARSTRPPTIADAPADHLVPMRASPVVNFHGRYGATRETD
jgi:hypothetical protein